MTAQVIKVHFKSAMKVVFVNGVPWSYAVLEEMARLRKEEPGWYVESKVDEQGRLVRTVRAPDGLRTFDHDVGLVGEIEPLCGTGKAVCCPKCGAMIGLTEGDLFAGKHCISSTVRCDVCDCSVGMNMFDEPRVVHDPVWDAE